MAKHGKNYTNAAAKFDKAEVYSPKKAMELVKELSTAKFDETVEASIRLGVDTRHPPGRRHPQGRPERPWLHLPAQRHRQDRPRRRLRRGRQGRRG